MFGSVLGDIAGISYFLVFQILGIILALYLFQKEKLCLTILYGSVLGSFAIHWLPTLYAFFFNFTIRAHFFAFLTFVIILWAVASFSKSKGRTMLNGRKIKIQIGKVFKEDPVIFVLIPLFIYVVVVLLNSTISYVDGAMHSGQSTYGDMNMHLGFITSIANQKVFPPEYSILPGTKLAYPFLSDSISSSIYIWGTSLRIAYLLPMFFALMQVFFGVYTLAKNILISFGRSYRGKSVLAFVLFFFNGGLGFVYFLNKGLTSENFTRIFTAFYETPTNYVDANVQWHNIICDMLIPQRATLFGWAMLFPILLILWQAVHKREMSYFIIAGILTGGLPLIHTHSFLALGVLCIGFVILDLVDHTSKKIKKNSEQNFFKKGVPIWCRLIIVAAVLGVLTFISLRQMSDTVVSSEALFAIGIAIAVFILVCMVISVFRYFDKRIITRWGVFLGIVLVLSLPILFTFTFTQASGDNFVRGFFNWNNSNTDTMDSYIIFYLKNMGVMFVLTVLVLICGKRRQIRTIMPAVGLWLICEFIVFQPNPYDNNKLMLVSYFFFCVATADFVWDTIPEYFIKSKKALKTTKVVLVTGVTIVGVLAAVLTMGREAVADYELYGSEYVQLCKWIEKNTETNEVFLTATNHNNAIASLTGRSIVCGSATFLYYHGLDYAEQMEAVALMYEDPASRDDLLDQYDVTYIVVGPTEYNYYNISDLDTMAQEYEVVYNKDGVIVFAI